MHIIYFRCFISREEKVIQHLRCDVKVFKIFPEFSDHLCQANRKYDKALSLFPFIYTTHI